MRPCDRRVVVVAMVSMVMITGDSHVPTMRPSLSRHELATWINVVKNLDFS